MRTRRENQGGSGVGVSGNIPTRTSCYKLNPKALKAYVQGGAGACVLNVELLWQGLSACSSWFRFGIHRAEPPARAS